MFTASGHRPVLSLPPDRYPESSSELFCQRRLRQAQDPSRRPACAAFDLIVHISPALESEYFVPVTWGRESNPQYFLDPVTHQPIVLNGFVWSHYRNGSRSRVQYFVAGVDLYGGGPLRIFNGVVNMRAIDGSILICQYRLGRCLAVTGRQARD